MPPRKAAAPKPVKPEIGVMATEPVDIGTLVLDDRNARKGDVAAMMKSLTEFGQHRAVVAQRGTNKVIVGNHLVLAARALGWERIAVHYVDDDDVAAQRRALTDNFVGDRAKWDEEQLTILLREQADAATTLPGLDDRLLDRLLAEAEDDKVELAIFPIVPKPMEGYVYCVVVARNELDGLWLSEVMGCVPMKSFKSKKVAMSRVIDVEMFKTALNRAIKRGEPFG